MICFLEWPAPLMSRGDTLETLLRYHRSSMLVIAVFAAGSMLTALLLRPASVRHPPLPLVSLSDISQSPSPPFIGASSSGIVGLIALMNGFYWPQRSIFAYF